MLGNINPHSPADYVRIYHTDHVSPDFDIYHQSNGMMDPDHITYVLEVRIKQQ